MEPPRADPTLIRKAQEGDREAFSTLVEAHRERLERFVAQRFGPRLKEQAEVEDVIQETLLRAFQAMPRFRSRGEGSFPGWLCGIAENVILKLAYRLERSRKLRLEREETDGEATPSRAARRDERFDRLRKALESLSPDHRRVILLARIEGLRMEEIARRMGRSTNAVMLLLCRALKKLRQSFGDTESFHLPLRSLRENGPDHGPRS